MRIRRSFLLLAIIALILALVPGCNTLRGMGKDVQRAGQKIQEVFR